jgi:hypothetical protein
MEFYAFAHPSSTPLCVSATGVAAVCSESVGFLDLEPHVHAQLGNELPPEVRGQSRAPSYPQLNPPFLPPAPIAPSDCLRMLRTSMPPLRMLGLTSRTASAAWSPPGLLLEPDGCMLALADCDWGMQLVAAAGMVGLVPPFAVGQTRSGYTATHWVRLLPDSSAEALRDAVRPTSFAFSKLAATGEVSTCLLAVGGDFGVYLITVRGQTASAPNRFTLHGILAHAGAEVAVSSMAWVSVGDPGGGSSLPFTLCVGAVTGAVSLVSGRVAATGAAEVTSVETFMAPQGRPAGNMRWIDEGTAGACLIFTHGPALGVWLPVRGQGPGVGAGAADQGANWSTGATRGGPQGARFKWSIARRLVSSSSAGSGLLYVVGNAHDGSITGTDVAFRPPFGSPSHPTSLHVVTASVDGSMRAWDTGALGAGWEEEEEEGARRGLYSLLYTGVVPAVARASVRRAHVALYGIVLTVGGLCAATLASYDASPRQRQSASHGVPLAVLVAVSLAPLPSPSALVAAAWAGLPTAPEEVEEEEEKKVERAPLHAPSSLVPHTLDAVRFVSAAILPALDNALRMLLAWPYAGGAPSCIVSSSLVAPLLQYGQMARKLCRVWARSRTAVGALGIAVTSDSAAPGFIGKTKGPNDLELDAMVAEDMLQGGAGAGAGAGARMSAEAAIRAVLAPSVGSLPRALLLILPAVIESCCQADNAGAGRRIARAVLTAVSIRAVCETGEGEHVALLGYVHPVKVRPKVASGAEGGMLHPFALLPSYRLGEGMPSAWTAYAERLLRLPAFAEGPPGQVKVRVNAATVATVVVGTDPAIAVIAPPLLWEEEEEVGQGKGKGGKKRAGTAGGEGEGAPKPKRKAAVNAASALKAHAAEEEAGEAAEGGEGGGGAPQL